MGVLPRRSSLVPGLLFRGALVDDVALLGLDDDFGGLTRCPAFARGLLFNDTVVLDDGDHLPAWVNR